MTAPSRAGRLSALRMRPLAACLAATIATAASGDGAAQLAGIDQATIVVVQNCNDSGPGSLRAAYANAVDNQTIDLTQLTCSRITLGSALVDPVAAASVTLRGPGKDLLAIDGDALYQVLVHRGNGALHIDHLTVTNGHYAGTHGGCIYSAGDVEAIETIVSACVLDTPELTARGGAIYARDSVSLFDSMVVDSSAKGASIVGGLGGGIHASGIVMSRSTVSGNTAAKGGGIHSTKLFDIEDSTVSGNLAHYYGGGLFMSAAGDGHRIRNSTISGNQAGNAGGAIYAQAVAIYNSTIALNTTGLFFAAGAGLHIGSSILESSIVANNTSGGGLIEDDVLAYGAVAGSNNVVMASTGPEPVAGITIDPKLGPLQDNGGPTQTHALLPGSPAIGRGNNTLGLDADQRGTPFGRVDGASADIGAFEFADKVFGNRFEPPA